MIIIEDRLVKPLHIAEILTVRQVGVLREHAHASLECAGMLRLDLQLELIVVALMTNHLELIDSIDTAVAGIGIRLQNDKLKTDGIVKALLVNRVAELILLTCLSDLIERSLILAHDTDAVPTLCNALLPLSNLLGKTVIVSLKLSATGCLLCCRTCCNSRRADASSYSEEQW